MQPNFCTSTLYRIYIFRPSIRTWPRMSLPHYPTNPSSYGFRQLKNESMPKTRLRAASQRLAPLRPRTASTSHLATVGLDYWDYSETEWWGWIILIVTWLVFVIGMGSCLGVWSWAWDVGETPYAPPELEDDPTLPIVGYYPALITLTAVMAWVWVMIAWVGMKYFRHAKISGEDI